MPVESISDIWAAVCEECKKHISPIAYETFFKFMKPESFNSTEFIISTNYEYIRDTIEELYTNLVSEAIKEVIGLNITPKFVYIEDEEKIVSAEKNNTGLSFEEFFTFDNFIVGQTNDFAYSASMAVADNFNVVYNPLVIFGPSGVGKTHLLLAIKNHIKKKHPYKKVHYTRGEEFTNELITALQSGKLGMGNIEDFRSKYRTADVLLVDDIHFIAGKERTQEEFYNTFDALYQSGKQIVVTLDRPLSEIKTLDDRIRSRFSSGLYADISIPDFETRIGIIRKKAEQANIKIDENLIIYIAEHIKSNTRNLEGVVKKLQAFINIQHKNPTITVVQSFIKDTLSNSTPEPIKIEKIIAEVARTYNVNEKDILSERRTSNLVLARRVAMYIAREMTSLSFKNIGEYFGKDHTTVLYNVTKIEEFLKDKPYENDLVQDLIKNLKGDDN